MAQIDLSMKQCEKFAEEQAKLMNNLKNTAQVFEDIVSPVAKKSGSDLLMGVAEDVREIKEEFESKAKTATRTAEGLKEYTKKLDKINQL